MILNHSIQKPIFVIGSGVVAEEIQSWLRVCTDGPIVIIDHSNFHEIPLGSSCMLAFWQIDYRIRFISNSDIELFHWPIYVHPTAYVDNPLSLGAGSIVYPMSQIGHKVCCGQFLLIGPMSTIGHGSQLGSNVVISPNTVIGGSSKIGNNVLFGQSSSIKNKISIVDHTKFTMQSIVTRDITQAGSYYGNKRANIQF